MLEELDRIDWKKLQHAYGSAKDVPDQIRALASNDDEIRKQALWQLWGNIIHQGTVYSATSYAVPFLIELLNAPAVKDKQKILVLLAALAHGSSYLDAHEPLFEKMGVLQKEMKQPRWHRRRKKELGWVEAARSAVVAGVPVFLKLLDDANAEVRLSAAYALAVGRERAAEIVPALQNRLNVEQDDRVKASIILCLGYVGHNNCSLLVEPFLGTETPAVVRTAAALASVWLGGERMPHGVIQALYEALNNPGPIDEDYQELPWSDGESVAAAASSALIRLRPPRDVMIPRMLDALERLPKRDTASIAMVGMILGLSFDVRKAPRGAAELSEFQREVLERLAGCDRAWDWGNTMWAFLNFGLPYGRKKLAEFLGRGIQLIVT